MIFGRETNPDVAFPSIDPEDVLTDVKGCYSRSPAASRASLGSR